MKAEAAAAAGAGAAPPPPLTATTPTAAPNCKNECVDDGRVTTMTRVLSLNALNPKTLKP